MTKGVVIIARKGEQGIVMSFIDKMIAIIANVVLASKNSRRLSSLVSRDT